MDATTYMALKHLHLTAVALSGALFLFRGGLMLAEANMLKQRWLRIVPHVIDTVLLLSALWLAVMVYNYPMSMMGWINAKVVALIIYIGLGVLTLKGPSKPVRTAAFAGAILTFGYIVLVGLHKQVIPL